jgi:hypothetical protein
MSRWTSKICKLSLQQATLKLTVPIDIFTGQRRAGVETSRSPVDLGHSPIAFASPLVVGGGGCCSMCNEMAVLCSYCYHEHLADFSCHYWSAVSTTFCQN